MENENRNAKTSEPQEAAAAPPKSLEALLAPSLSGSGLTIRDDLFDVSLLRDAVRWCRMVGTRFRLVDSGRLDRSQLEWLLEAGADLYTSDEFDRDIGQLEGLVKALRRGKALMAYHARDPFPSSSAEAPPFDLFRLGRSGAYVHVSNREHALDPGALEQLARECEAGGAHMVFYAHGEFSSDWQDLARCRLWCHVDESSLAAPESRTAFEEVLKTSRQRARFVLLTEGKLDALWLQDLMRAGVILRFQKKQFDYRSSYSPLEKASSGKRLPITAYYLYPDYLL